MRRGSVDRAPELAAELVRLKVDIIVAAGGAGRSGRPRMRPRRFPSLWWALGSILSRQAWLKVLPVLAAMSPALPWQRTRREAAGAAQRSRSQSCPCCGSQRSGRSSHCTRGERRSPNRGACAGVDHSALGGTCCGRFREGLCCAKKQRPDGLYVLGGPLMRTNEKRIVGFALKSRLPSTYYFREAVDAGGLMYYGADLADSYRRVAYFLDRILKGAKPADLPVEQPTKFELRSISKQLSKSV